MKGRILHRILTTLGCLAAVACAPTLTGCNADPGQSEMTPLYRPPGFEGTTSGERGSVMINEVNFAGSVTNGGTHDWDDIFIELQNKSERPVDLTGWRLYVRGGHSETYRIPESEPVQPNDYFVIAAKEDGAFGEVADVVMEELEMGRRHIWLELKDRDKRLMGVVGSHDHRVFAGGWDTVSVRTMERVQLIFLNSGTSSRSWHAYSANSGFETIADGYRKHTLGSPGAANSTDYSGSTSSGSFE